MEPVLTTLQAFNAMTKFLDDFYDKTASADVGSLLGDMSFLQDGSTADKATWHDWIDALGNDRPVTKTEAYKAMVHFLDYCRENTSSDDIGLLLYKMQLDQNGVAKDPALSNLCTECVDKALREPDGSRSYLKLM